MPFLQRLAERANEAFNRHNIGKLDADSFTEARSLSEVAKILGIAETSAEREFLDSWPPSIQEAFKAALRSALRREPRVPITIAWAPGYDFELMIAEAKTLSNSIGGITLFFRSRYPGDRLPA